MLRLHVLRGISRFYGQTVRTYFASQKKKEKYEAYLWTFYCAEATNELFMIFSRENFVRSFIWTKWNLVSSNAVFISREVFFFYMLTLLISWEMFTWSTSSVQQSRSPFCWKRIAHTVWSIRIRGKKKKIQSQQFIKDIYPSSRAL